MEWPKLPVETMLKRLEPPTGHIDIVLDTDTYNEVDDQFALYYALLSPERMTVQAVYAAPFHNFRSEGPEDGMEKSYNEILRLIKKMKISPEGFAFKGSRNYLPAPGTPVDSPAARDIIARAMARPDGDPLYVVETGCITTVASALLMEPRLVEKIVVVFLGGNTYSWDSAKEFNLMQDIFAAQVVFDSGVPLIQLPAMTVTALLTTSIHELRACIGGKNEICDTLVQLCDEYYDDHYARSKEIWDIGAIAFLVNSEWVRSSLIHSPRLSEDGYFSSQDTTRHFIRQAYHIIRDEVFRDLFDKLSGYKG